MDRAHPRIIPELLTKHHLEFLSLRWDCTGSSESIHVKMSHCWKSHVAAHLQPSSGARGLLFGLSLYQLPLFMYASRKDPGKTEQIPKLTEPSLISYAISIKILRAGQFCPFYYCKECFHFAWSSFHTCRFVLNSRTSKRLSYGFQGLKIYENTDLHLEILLSKC